MLLPGWHRGLKRERTERERSEWRKSPQYQKAAVEAIVKVLKEMWNNQHEIPVIACFRKQVSSLHFAGRHSRSRHTLGKSWILDIILHSVEA